MPSTTVATAPYFDTRGPTVIRATLRTVPPPLGHRQSSPLLDIGPRHLIVPRQHRHRLPLDEAPTDRVPHPDPSCGPALHSVAVLREDLEVVRDRLRIARSTCLRHHPPSLVREPRQDRSSVTRERAN